MLFDLKSLLPIAKFATSEEFGHQSQVLSVDFHATEPYFVSAGLDHTIMIWHYGTKEINKKIEESGKKFNNWNLPYPLRQYLKVVAIYLPHWYTRDVHSNYIDTVRWFNNMIFSRATNEPIILWKPGSKDKFTQLKDLKFEFPPREDDNDDKEVEEVKDEEEESKVNIPSTSNCKTPPMKKSKVG